MVIKTKVIKILEVITGIGAFILFNIGLGYGPGDYPTPNDKYDLRLSVILILIAFLMSLLCAMLIEIEECLESNKRLKEYKAVYEMIERAHTEEWVNKCELYREDKLPLDDPDYIMVQLEVDGNFDRRYIGKK